MYIDLASIKKHLNIDSGFTDDDAYITSLEGVAETAVAKHIDMNLTELVDGGALPAPLTQAMLLLIGNMYNTREAVTFANAIEVPIGYNYLLDLYKNYAKTEENGGTFG